jgi:transcriptional regulator with XRE-family HTH domain
MNTDKNWEIVELDTVATGYKIKSLMDEQNVSIRDVSDFMKVSFQAVYRWQKGETLPTISNMYILGQLLGTDVDDMLVAKKK